jgi:hypothetical protein
MAKIKDGDRHMAEAVTQKCESAKGSFWKKKKERAGRLFPGLLTFFTSCLP